MKLEIFQDLPQHELTVYLRLVKDSDGDISVQAVDAKGERLYRGYLVMFQGGRIRRATSVHNSLGFDLDEQGRIKEVADDH